MPATAVLDAPTLSDDVFANPNPTTPAFQDNREWITAYLTIHSLSSPSYRYAYILWLLLALFLVSFAVLHAVGARGSALGALWSKWALRRRTWRKAHALAAAARKHRPHIQPTSLPSNAQLLAFAALAATAFVLCAAGPDYISPRARVFDFTNTPTSMLASTDGVLQLQYTINKAYWTAAARVGAISFALAPLCVLCALRAPPAALFALRAFGGLHADKLARAHRAIGRLIWFLAAVHASLWAVQLARDRRADTGRRAWAYAFFYTKFIWGVAAFILLTLLVGFSIRPLRCAHYGRFFTSHVVLTPAFLVTAGLHHPSVGWFLWAPLALWITERVWRATWVLYTNGVFSRLRVPAVPPTLLSEPLHLGAEKLAPKWELGPRPQHPDSDSQLDVTKPPPLLPLTPRHAPAPAASLHYTPPPGYAHAVLLPGCTVRLVLSTPGVATWAPGQHYLVRIPAIGVLPSHPFTAASADGALVFLVRAKGGWTKRLWDATAHGPPVPASVPASAAPPTGVLLRALVDGPFGSPARVHWGAHGAALIVTGGSGVTFGLSVLEGLCMRATEHAVAHKPFRTRRVRFVWIVREYAHIQWCASALQRCAGLAPRGMLELEISIFVTHGMLPAPRASLAESMEDHPDDATLAAPAPRFSRPRSASMSSMDGTEEDDGVADPAYYFRGSGPAAPTDAGALGYEEHALDYTNFDGDDDTAMPGESALSHSVRREGRMRRARSRIIARTESPLHSTDQLLPPPPGAAPARASLDGDGHVHDWDAAHAAIAAPALPSPPVSRAPSVLSLGASSQTHVPAYDFDLEAHGADGADAKIHTDAREMRDMHIMSELARPGKPRLERILADEVERAGGPLVVACCGPLSLNAMMRKLIAAQIDPRRVLHGDQRGSITFVSEEFEY